MNYLLTTLLLTALLLPTALSFSPLGSKPQSSRRLTSSSLASSTAASSVPPSIESASERVENCKRVFIQFCDGNELGRSSADIEGKIKELERLGEDVSVYISYYSVDVLLILQFLNNTYHAYSLVRFRLALVKHRHCLDSCPVNGNSSTHPMKSLDPLHSSGRLELPFQIRRIKSLASLILFQHQSN